MRSSKFGAYLSVHVQRGVLALQVRSMPPLILLRLDRTKEGESANVGGDRGDGRASISNLGTPADGRSSSGEGLNKCLHTNWSVVP